MLANGSHVIITPHVACQVHSGFKRIGLWEACFAGLVLERDPTQRAYHGCWWILAPEYHKIRDYLMPWWFIIVQVATTLCIMMQLINIFLQIHLLRVTAERDATGGPKRAPMAVVQVSTIFCLINGKYERSAVNINIILLSYSCA